MNDPAHLPLERYSEAEQEAWHRGFIAGCALMGGHRGYYEEERDRFLAKKGWDERNEDV